MERDGDRWREVKRERWIRDRERWREKERDGER